MKISDIPGSILDPFRRGMVIPALPLALNADRRFDELHQKALIRYYIDAGAGGIAVGVHSTQFEIRDPKHGLFQPVLTFCSRVVDAWCEEKNTQIIKIAGICGRTDQAEKEARYALEQGYHACLLSLGALKEDEIGDLIKHCRTIAAIMPVIGFYLQPAAGGRVLPYNFWREFAEINNVLAIKIAPFNRYQTIDVVRAVCDAGREEEIILYSGNDDNILLDLLTEYQFKTTLGIKRVRIRGGLLGHWAVWTSTAVDLLNKIHEIIETESPVAPEILTQAIEITDCNAALFDAVNNFAGCIPGIHEVLYRQGLFSTVACLNQEEILSPGQKEEIDRIYAAYPRYNDDEYVRANLDKWLH